MNLFKRLFRRKERPPKGVILLSISRGELDTLTRKCQELMKQEVFSWSNVIWLPSECALDDQTKEKIAKLLNGFRRALIGTK